MLRLFQRGKDEEPRLIKLLRDVGVEVFDIDPSTNKQYRVSGYKGHFGGELDGVGQGIIDGPFLLEFKTHGDKSFKELVQLAVEASKPTHFVQMQMYMGFMGLPKALYIAVNKNDDTLYFEDVPFMPEVFESYKERAAMIIDDPRPPVGISRDPTYYECKWCEHHPICHLKAPPLKNCRTCVHSTPVDHGQWVCEQDRSGPTFPIIPQDIIKQGCPNYCAHPMD